MKHPIKKSTGIGLIEVLITTLVVALGLLAVASLQGNLMSGSGLNKARGEALQLANLKMEQLRDQIVITGYNSIVSGKDAAVDGTNQTFVRYWLVENGTDPTRKTIQVMVAWSATGTLAANAADATAAALATAASTTVEDEQVIVQSVVAYDKVAVSYSLASGAANPNTGATIGSPTTNAASSFDINDSINVAITGGVAGELFSNTPNAEGQYIKATSSTKGSIVYKCVGETATIPFIPYENGLYTRRMDDDGDGFKEIIELAVSNNDNLFGTGVHSCTRKVRYNGGIILPMKGRVYLDASAGANSNQNPITVLGLNSSESGVFCVYNPSINNSFAYACYVGGNCRRETAGGTITTTDGLTNTYYGLSAVPASAPAGSAAIPSPATAPVDSNTIVTQCPAPHVANVTPLYGPSGCTTGSCVYDSVGHGGWRGNVGLEGLIVGNVSRTSCFAGTISNNSSNTPEAEKAATARLYKSLRSDSSQTSPKSDEGINKSYMCHDFLIVGTSGPNNCTTAAKGALNLASKTIVRSPGNAAETAYTFTGTPTAVPNKVDFKTTGDKSLNVDQSSCHVITGTVPTGVTAVGVSATYNAGFDCTVDTTAHTYSCIGTSQATSITVAATAGGTASKVVTLSPSTMTVPNMNLSVPSTTYTITGSITGSDTARAAVTVAINGTFCAKSPTNGAASTQNVTYTCSVTTSPPITVPVFVSGGAAAYDTIALATNTASSFAGPSVSAGACSFNGSVVNSGSSVTAYSTATTVPFGSLCSETRTCTNGTLSGSYTSATATSCTVAAAAICDFNGTPVNHGSSVIAYNTDATVPFGGTCSESRVCDNGTLSGTYTSSTATSCGVLPATPAPGWSTTGSPKTLSWTAASGATGYKVYKCANTTNAACTVDTTGTPVQTAATLSYTPAALTSRSAVCMKVVATNSTGSGNASAAYCMYRAANGTITYTP